jgi:hypothetical protein
LPQRLQLKRKRKPKEFGCYRSNQTVDRMLLVCCASCRVHGDASCRVLGATHHDSTSYLLMFICIYYDVFTGLMGDRVISV